MPSTPLLAAKLFPPPYRSSLVARPRLTRKLDEGLRAGQKVTLVCAPAGFGKTTLVVEWLEQFAATSRSGGRSFGWLSLEPSDNDLVMFLRYLLAALQAIHPQVGQSTQELVGASRLPAHDALLMPLLNDLHALTEPFVLVLDDYHSIQDPAIHEALAFFLERQPPSMHTVITTRQDPLLPLARWRARGQLTDVRLGELRFTEAEAAEFLNRSMGLSLTADDIAALESRTEGWIAGLQMAAISLQQTDPEGGSQAADAFIQSFTGDDRFVMDYLVDEVLGRQPPEVQSFLLKTSVLERFNAALCAAVLDGSQPTGERSGTQAAAEMLAYLESANLFLIPLDNRRQWYRYHHLFAELLQYRLNVSQGSGSAVELKRIASQWCDDNGFPDQAVRYAQTAGDWALSAQRILAHSPSLIRQGEMVTLLQWMRGMPDAAIRQNVALCVEYGYVLTQIGQLNAGQDYLDLAEQNLSDDPAGLGKMSVFASINALFRGDFARQISLARRGLALLPPDDAWMRAQAALSLGMGLLHSGLPQEAESAFQEALHGAQRAESVRTIIFAYDQLGRVSVLHGDFAQAEVYFRHAVQYKSGEKPYPGCDMPYFDLAMLKYEQNDLTLAAACVAEGLEANRRSGSAEMLAYGYRLEARLRQLADDGAGAAEYLLKALRLAANNDLSPLTLSLNAALEVEMALTEGDLHRAGLAAPRVTNSLGVYPFAFFPETARVHLLLAQNRPAEAMQLLETARPRAEQPGWNYPRLQVRVLQALGAPSPAAAQAFLSEALALAMPAGAVRVFLDLGEPMRRLLQEGANRLPDPAMKAYALQLLSAFPGAGAPAAAQGEAAAGQGLVEPLSEREIEVLKLLAAGLSNAEIAQKLYLSPNTLKAHTQNIYGKLDVHSRVQAVNRARELKII